MFLFGTAQFIRVWLHCFAAATLAVDPQAPFSDGTQAWLSVLLLGAVAASAVFIVLAKVERVRARTMAKTRSAAALESGAGGDTEMGAAAIGKPQLRAADREDLEQPR